MMPDLNLPLLLPEIVMVLVVTLLGLFEIFFPERIRRFLMPFNLGGIVLVGAALAGLLRHPGIAFGGMFVSDPFALFFKFLFLGTLACVFIIKDASSLRDAGTEFYLIFWSALLGMFCLVSSKDFLLFFISLELLTLSLYLLAAYTRRDLLAIEAGLKYLVLGSLASAFLLYGISLIYASTGTLSFDDLGEILIEEGGIPSWLFLLGVLLVLSGLGFKVAAVPFQVWVPDVYEGAPTPVVAFFSAASKSAGFAALLRILFEALGPLENERRILFSLFALLTLLYGNLGALVQKNMKRLLGFSSIGHAGFLLMGLASDPAWGPEALLYYLAAHAVTNLAAFLVVARVESQEGSSSLEAFQGLSRRSPLLAAGLFLALLSLAGVPPLAGFFAKFWVLLAAAKSHLVWLVILAALNVAVSLYYYLNVVRIVYVEKPKEESPLSLTLAPRALLLGLMAAIVILGVWQAPISRVAFLANASLQASFF